MKDFTNYTDEALCTLLPTGESESAFSHLYNRYSERLYHNILGMVKDESTAEELVQDIFLAIWQKKDQLQIDKTFSGFLFTSSRNKVYDFFRKVKRDRQLYAHIKAVATEHYTHIEETLLQKEHAALLQNAMDHLPPQRKKVFELCKVEGLSYKEAGEKLGLSVSTIKDHMAKARQSIREYIFSKEDLVIGFCIYLFWRGM